MSGELPDWLTVGAKVALLESRGPSESCSSRTVKSIGKRYIVLDTGTRFDRERYDRSGEFSRYNTGPFGVFQRLVSLDHPKAVEIRARRSRYATEQLVERLLRDWRGNGDLDLLQQAIDVLSKHLPSGGAA